MQATAHLALPVLLFAAGALAQTTHLVGPGGLAQIRDALLIAAPGDLVLVQPGTYAQFHANVGVTIRAAVPGTVVVAYDASVLSAVCSSDPFCLVVESRTRIAPPAGQTVHCEGLEFARAAGTASPGAASASHRRPSFPCRCGPCTRCRTATW